MKTEPTIDKIALIETVHREYGPEIERLTFVLAGWGGYGYVADCTCGEHYYLKLASDSTQPTGWLRPAGLCLVM